MDIKKQFIDGKWVYSNAKNSREIINPFNQKSIAQVTESNETDAKTAVAAARKAFDYGDWAYMSSLERGKIVRKIAELIERDKEELATLETLNTGKTLEESRWDMDDIACVFHYYADLAQQKCEEIIDSQVPNSVSKVVYEPVGVCAQITPWNYPLLQASWKLAPALVAGNTLVMKPSEITPLTTIKVFELMEEAGVPKGVVNLVLGPGHTVGAELSVHTDVDLVSFTGGLETGKKIMQAASSNVKKVALELGGKNPNIIFADADFNTAVDQAMNAVFFHAGQICSAGTRIIVEESIHDTFIDALVRRVKNIRLGNGFEESTEMGPLISKEHLQKVISYVKDGIEEGATVAIGGRQPESEELKAGFFYLPTVLTDCTTNMSVVQNEGFGPVITVEKFSTEEEAIILANDSPYGLSGGVWTQDLAKAERCVAKMRMGTVWINDFNIYFPQAPWGGFKQSGFGRELGKTGLQEYQEQKHVFHNLQPEAMNWFGTEDR
ncbi:betaine-aldehyde dehydrogenase [Pseudogracilibacillus auburnensis]|uniref:Betaine-aldehyde dehydrogenase n=1 Tax=Pseudogracilibacillus auburnensis TaxID=1494959 RepID=A0A2V3VP29_9BACI|nr:betaine-aldehyde dehydrogenase [Pseudogracilibacillus auburnensis]MBO1002547.1 betaine-aldehyde dehydrogenase [Pseudogracilibacillus auburnensis]PXW82611.1 aldehyde dehydrogenase (acceptor) [Pseudogracilibacillus auburnensis]